MESITHQMGVIDPQSPEYEKIADRYHRLETEFHTRDGYSLEAQTGAVLNGLGFSRQDMDRSTDEFSEPLT